MTDRTGVWLGVDVGTVRLGVAVCDPDGLLATPVTTLTVPDGDAGALAPAVSELVAAHGAVGVVVGLPRNLSGADGTSARMAREFAQALSSTYSGPVYLVDERLTTVDAHRRLRQSGVSDRRARAFIDQAAAVLILQAALDHRASRGTMPGEFVGTTRTQRKPRMKGRG